MKNKIDLLFSFTVYRLNTLNKNQIKQIKSLNVDFWNGRDVLVEPFLKDNFLGILKELNLSYQVLIEDVGDLIEENELKNSLAKAKIKNTLNLHFDYETYHNLNEIYEWMDLMKQNYPNYITLINVTKSFENRIIKILKISVNQTQDKKAIWIDGAIHAREWITPAVLLYISNELVSKYGNDSNITEILNNFDFYILPVFNVDGK